MNEYVFVEFMFFADDALIGTAELNKLDKGDFIVISSDIEWDGEQDVTMPLAYHRVTGKIKSDIATVLTLSDSFLGKHMHISYISDSLKNKYRS